MTLDEMTYEPVGDKKNSDLGLHRGYWTLAKAAKIRSFRRMDHLRGWSRHGRMASILVHLVALVHRRGYWMLGKRAKIRSFQRTVRRSG